MSGVRKHFWQEVRRWCGGFSRPWKYGLSGCMPAVVSRTDGSCSAGTSDAGGQPLVVAALEEAQEAVTDLVGGHVAESRLRAHARHCRRESSTRTAGCGSTRTSPSSRTARRALRLDREAAVGDRRRRSRTASGSWSSSATRWASASGSSRRARGRTRRRRPPRRWRAASWPRRPACGRRRLELPRPPVLRLRHLRPVRRRVARDGLAPGERALESTEQGLIARRFARAEVERMIRSNEIRTRRPSRRGTCGARRRR